MNGPQNVLMGDSQAIELPQAQLDEQDLQEERVMAKFSKSAEFKRLKEHFEQRIDFYQTYLPNGAEIGLEVAPSAEDWRVANRVIAELKTILLRYELANDVVKEAESGKN